MSFTILNSENSELNHNKIRLAFEIKNQKKKNYWDAKKYNVQVMIKNYEYITMFIELSQ